MVVGALAIRSLIDGGDGAGGSSGGSGGGGDGSVRLVCVSEVQAACEQLAEEDDDVEVTVASAGTTLEQLADPAFRGSQSAYDGWVTLEPLPEVVDARRDQAGDDQVLADPSAPLASSEVVLVAADDRAEVLTEECGAPSAPDSDDVVVSVLCVASAAGQPWAELGGESTWGPIRYGFSDPGTTAAGFVTLGQLATAFFEAADPPLTAEQYASNDFSSGFRSYLALIADEADTGATGGTPLQRLIQRGPSAFGAVAALDATAQEEIAGTRAEDTLTVLYPSPMATAVVTMAPVGGSPGADDVLDEDLLADLRAALADTGWNTDDPTPAGLPRPGVADALEQLWSRS